MPANDPGLLTPAETSLLTDQYELAMASSYLTRGMNELAVFELFARRLLRERARAELGAVPEVLRELKAERDVYPVAHSQRCRAAAAALDAEAA